jgi:Abnormal spindle-like microcephaly-assoc'd, ASPM-SPD-2-Hydin
VKPIARLLVLTHAFAGVAVLFGCSGGPQSSQQPPQQPPPPPTLMITTIGLPDGVTGTSYSEPIQATGGAAPFSWSVAGGALPPNFFLGSSSTNTVTISGTPETAAQNVGFTIQVKDSAGDSAQQTYTVSISLPADGLVLSYTGLNFGNRILGTVSGPQPETLTNNSTSDLAITSITTSGTSASNFTQTSSTCGTMLAAGANCTINVAFAPVQAGPVNGTITIVDDAVGSPQVVSLSGVGVVSGSNATFSPGSLTFGTQLVDTTSPPSFLVLTNYGTATLHISSIAPDSAEFAETDNCTPSVAAGAACTINVTFTPGASGDVTSTLSLADDAAGSPQTVALSGTGSTNTPLLNGYCLHMCGSRSLDSSQCPVGQPSETPAPGPSCPVGPSRGHGGPPVDLARACQVSPRDSGYCELQ